MDGGYGIFSRDGDLRWATLRFSSQAAPWIKNEEWHPQQERQDLPDGGVQLRVPYSHPKEIVMDILRHGGNVEVLADAELRAEISEQLERALKLYRSEANPSV
jgi:predicted DNA-binding transcriptional regulator YafY